MNAIADQLASDNPDAILWDGLDDALIGIAERCSQPSLAVYSWDRLVELHMREGMSYEDACEYIGFNIIGAWHGEHTPLVMYIYEDDEEAKS